MSDPTERRYFTPLDANNPFTALANEIIKRELEGKQPTEKPVALFTIGPPGAGKTTLVNSLAQESEGRLEQVPVILALKKSGRIKAKIEPHLNVTHSFENTVYINTTGYREELAESALAARGMKKGIDYAGEGSPPSKASAFAYISREKYDPALRKLVGQTGSEIAKQLLLQSVERGYPTVLDSTGGGFAADPEQVTAPLMRAAKASGTHLEYLRVDVSLLEALERVKAGHESGKTAFVSREAIIADIERAPIAVKKLREQAEIHDVPMNITTVNQDFKIDPTRCYSVNSEEPAQAPRTPPRTHGHQGNGRSR